MLRSRLLLVLAALSVGACVHASSPVAPPARRGLVREGTPASVDIALARGRGQKRAFTWSTWSPESFERARRENRLILLDGAAAWCHWCHVMDETTYLDPEVGRVLSERFVAIRVDVDERPDIEERYGDWGWPATILLTPDGRELGKYRGYLPADDLLSILREVGAGGPGPDVGLGEARDVPVATPPVEALPWIGARVARDMDAYYDPKQGGWGRMQKSPLGANAEFDLRRHAHGDSEALGRVVLTLEKQRALIDPVWGGVYQYSTGGGWNAPHFEKLMPYQAANLEAYARAYAVTGKVGMLEDARRIAGYLTTFLSNADGAFLVSQDADVGAHDPAASFVDGQVYYAKGDRERRALGMPRIDDHVYAYENGLAIAALCTLYEVSHDHGALARARRAADLLLRSHVTEDGAVKRAAESARQVRYLADAASFGRAMARLAESTGELRYREAATRIAGALIRDFGDADDPTFWAHTPDGSAVGVFARRQRPFGYNVSTARLFGALARVTGDSSWRDRGRRVLAGISTPRALDERGRMVGEYLLALDEVGALGW